MFKRVMAIIAKETRELLRDPLYLGLALVVPMMIIIIMGEGMTLDVKNIPVAFYDRDRSAASREPPRTGDPCGGTHRPVASPPRRASPRSAPAGLRQT